MSVLYFPPALDIQLTTLELYCMETNAIKSYVCLMDSLLVHMHDIHANLV